MSATSSRAKLPLLIQVVKHLAGKWRLEIGRRYQLAPDRPTTLDDIHEYKSLPIWTLLDLIEKNTVPAFSRALLEHFAWYSNRPLERMPLLEGTQFKEPDSELEGIPEDLAIGKCLE